MEAEVLFNTMLLMADSVGACRLTKQSGGESMRTNEIEGVALNLPVVGRSFYMRATPLDQDVADKAKADGNPCGRLFNTSKLVSVTETSLNKYELTTASGSKYFLEMYDAL